MTGAVALGLVLAFVTTFVSPPVFAQTSDSLTVDVHSQTGEPVAGAAVLVERRDGFLHKVATDPFGKAAISELPTGQYRITVSTQDFEPSTETFVIQDARQKIEIEFTLISRLQRQESFDVIAETEAVGVQGASPPAAELHPAEITSLPSRPASVAEALPLVPGVTRDPTGEIQIAGQGEQRSALVVNASDVTDPATGRFGNTVPIDSIQSVGVLKTPFLPQYGRFTA
jgi:hypothetical protein